MTRFRISLAGLMGLIAIAGVGIAALRFASETWAGVMLVVTLAFLGVAVLGVIYRREATRAWWLGFALFGGGYLVLTLGPWFSTEVQPKLPTTHVLTYVYAKLKPAPPQKLSVRITAKGDGISISNATDNVSADIFEFSPQNITFEDILGSRLLAISGNEQDFTQVGHCLLAWVAGMLGALIACWFHASRDSVTQEAD